MQSQITVGNDIVDLKDSESIGKTDHTRFVERVFSSSEIEFIKDNDVRLWQLWSAKETAYKILKKINPKTIFAHKSFEVNPERSLVKFAGHSIPVKWESTADYIHCYGCLGGNVELLKRDVLKIADSSQSSLLVRQVAKKIFSEQGYQDVQIEREEGGAPFAKIDGKRSEFDLSLSHHGSWVAAVVS